MFVKKISDCVSFTANDGCQIQELLHPENDDIELPYSMAIAVVDVGKQSYKHKLKQTEVYSILAGHACMHINDEARDVSAGDAIFIPADATQWIENTGALALQFIAIVNPAWRKQDDVRQ